MLNLKPKGDLALIDRLSIPISLSLGSANLAETLSLGPDTKGVFSVGVPLPTDGRSGSTLGAYSGGLANPRVARLPVFDGKNLFKAQAIPSPLSNGVGAAPGTLSQIGYFVPNALNFYVAGKSRVSGLFRSSGPSHVSGLVSLIVISAVKRMKLAGLLPSVGSKALEAIPYRGDANTSLVVQPPRLRVGVSRRATKPHRKPSWVERVLGVFHGVNISTAYRYRQGAV